MQHGQKKPKKKKKKKKIQRIPELEESGGLHGSGGICIDPLRNLDTNGHVVLWAVGRRWGFQEKAQKQTGVLGTLRACGALGWSAEHASGTLAAHEYWAEEFLPLNKLGNRKSLRVSHRDVSLRAVHW